jgi:glutaredoxin
MITIYTKKYCEWCDKAKELLNSLSIPFSEYKIGEDIPREWILNTFPTMHTVPIILYKNQLIGGYQDLLHEINTNIHFGKTLLLE